MTISEPIGPDSLGEGPNPQHIDGLTVLRFDGEATAVRLATFMPRFPKEIPFRKIAARTWAVGLRLPATARVEYLIETEDSGRTSRRLDPANPQMAGNPFGANSVAWGPDYRLPAWMRRPSPVSGRVTEIRVQSKAFEGRRHHSVYSPPGALASTPLPLLIVHDGTDYRRYSGLCDALDALIGSGSVRPVRAVLVDPRERHREYIADARHTSHIIEEVVPHVERRYATVKPFGVMGASLGAVAAWHVAHTAPAVFGRLFLQSGTFARGRHPQLSNEMHQQIARFVTSAMESPVLGSARVYQTCGRYESLGQWNQVVSDGFKSAGIESIYAESWAGHDWGAWRDHFETGLAALYPPTPSQQG